MANRGDQGRRRSGDERAKRANRRAMTVGAAASLMLSVTPVLVAPGAAATSQTPLGAHRSQISTTSKGAAIAYRARLRTAVSSRVGATHQANVAFDAAAGPHRAAYVRARAASPDDARAARVRYGQNILTAKLKHRAAIESLRLAYVEAAEQARVDFLVARGASTDTIAHAKFRQAVNDATAEYQLAIVAARDSHRANSATARAADVVAAADQGSPQSADAIRFAVVDVTAVFRTQLSTAHDSYQAKLTLAKRTLKTAAAR